MKRIKIIRVLLLLLNFTLFTCGDNPDNNSSGLEGKTTDEQVNTNTELRIDSVQKVMPDDTVSNNKTMNDDDAEIKSVESKEGGFNKDSKKNNMENAINKSVVERTSKNNSNLSQVEETVQENQPFVKPKQKESEGKKQPNENSKPVVTIENSPEVNETKSNPETLTPEEKEEIIKPVKKEEISENIDKTTETTKEKSEETNNKTQKEFPQSNNTWIIPQAAVSRQNPFESNKESIRIGKTLYSKHCKSCHGKRGLGDGPKADQLDTSCKDFTIKDFQDQPDGVLFYKSREGRDDMPSFKKKIPDEEDIWHIVNYLRTFYEG